MSEYTFRPMTRADYPMFSHWLDQPHIEGWWQEGATELRLIEDDLKTGLVDMRIAELGGTPFAFIQDYNAHAFGAPHYVDYNKDARAVDTFLGDSAFLGKGHGAGYIGASIAELRKSYPLVIVDPETRNTRAIAAYARAGFRKDKPATCEDGTPVQIMTYS
jgi:aminoglycoside 6'-N-acetyltransferase